jgi:UDPglucose--hexose-1-phosphate uridylyltransferase
VTLAARVWRSTAKLADGREIIYFDESPASGRASAADPRDLAGPVPPALGEPPPALGEPPRAVGELPRAGELRWDRLSREWVAFAEQRQDRTLLPSASDCPLCPSRPDHNTEIPAASYDVVAFENRFPALPAGRGRCEVMCFTADHDASFASLSPRRAATVLSAWADRTAELGSADGIEHVYCFENRGAEVGATLHHPHGQVYALPFVPPRARQLAASAREYRSQDGGNLFDHMLAVAIADGRRVVASNEHWTAFVPWAAHWPFEVLLFPHQRVADLACLSPSARAAFPGLYLDVLGRLDRLFGTPMPYMAAWQQAPSRDQAARAELALHLQVMTVRRAPGRLKFMASTEAGAGVWSNDVLPETAARMLREAG